MRTTERLAHYLNQLVFCLYSEDAGLLPEGLFARHRTRTTSASRHLSTGRSAACSCRWRQAVSPAPTRYAHFNGDLFNVVDTVELSTVALQRLGEACERNWRDIEPSIFGTLFERALDASKRAQTGAHYTGADDIELVVKPVVMTPLRREWQETRAAIDKLLDSEQESNAVLATTQRTGFEPLPRWQQTLRTTAWEQLDAFRQRLASVKVLDPACGSGNFLYIALRSLLGPGARGDRLCSGPRLARTDAVGATGPDAGTGDQPLRGGTGTDGAVDRLYPVAPRQTASRTRNGRS